MCFPDSIHGVSICTVSPGIIQSCQDFMFTKASRGRMSGKLVLFFSQHVLYFSPFFAAASLLDSVSNICQHFIQAEGNIVLQQLVLLSSQWGLFHYESQYSHVIHSRITEAWLPDNSLCAFILLKVEVDSDCTKIALGQRVAVTVKTVPSYCGIDWRGTYEAPGKNLGRLFPV